MMDIGEIIDKVIFVVCSEWKVAALFAVIGLTVGAVVF